jgi:hypothetical protein
MVVQLVGEDNCNFFSYEGKCDCSFDKGGRLKLVSVIETEWYSVC